MFHSFRILDFGIQIAEYPYRKGLVFNSNNDTYENIIDMFNDGESIESIMEKMKERHNRMQTRFRQLAPKE